MEPVYALELCHTEAENSLWLGPVMGRVGGLEMVLLAPFLPPCRLTHHGLSQKGVVKTQALLLGDELGRNKDVAC